MPVPLTLKVFKGETLVTSKDFERDIIKIGRLASAHLCLDDEKVSRIHSVIEVAADGSLSIIDMGSVEGTYVNGKRVNKGQLAFGDEIKVGGTTIRLDNPAAVAAVNLASAAASAAPTPVPTAPVETSLAAGLAQTAGSPAPAATPAPVAVVQQPVAAAAPAPKAVAQPVAEAPAAEPAPRVRRVARKGRGPLGLGLHFMWGDQRVGEFFLAPGKKQSFTVGSAKGVNFIMGDAKLGGERFEVVRTDGQSFTVLFTGKMKGELTRKGETMDLKAVIESGKASHEGEAYALTLKEEDFLSVDLGGVTLEALFESVPKRAFAPLSESVDYAVVNIFLVMFFLASMFVISASNLAAAGDEYADELAGSNSRIAKLIVKPPETQKNKFLEKLNQQKAEKQAEKAAKAKKDEAQTVKKDVPKQQASSQAKPDKRAAAKNMAAKIFGGKGGAASLFGGGGLGGDLKSAMGNMFGAKGNAAGGFGGLGLRGGGGGGGGGGQTIGIGAVGTKGRGGGMGGYGSGVGGLGGKQSVEVGIAAEDATVTGSLDKELIRQVIQRNKGQIRFCYESLLNRYPKLGGKVSIRFTIASEGNVVTSSVAQSTAGNSELEQCVAGRVRTWSFPKPKGGGSVVVTYPFIFKAAGE
ncbi:adventurous gliding motility protein GltG [Archangium violaceum]|uniref:adventurous gliding motility protein GltG n=1 Tax=Archangium violaceum TaxID=83451 RepID=UPI00193B1C48|nr:adventurous gliding motility protein GltG [Archangium violaceum]QRK05163.1 adventurous gliding motility protein GltG [Archangium violaceum]